MVIAGTFVLVTLAVARITRLVTADRLMLAFRRWAVNRFGEDSNWAYLVHCKACASVWIAFPAATVWALSTLPWRWWWLLLPAWMAMSQLTILLAQLEEDE